MYRGIYLILSAIIVFAIAACSLNDSANQPEQIETLPPPTPPIAPTAIIGDGPGLGPIGGNPDDPGGVGYFLISEEDGPGHTRVGCDSFLVPRGSGIEFTFSDPAADVQNALGALFNANPADLTNFWSGAQIADIALNGSAMQLDITNGYSPVGVCADAAALAQVLMIVFNNGEVQQATITVDGQNLRQMLDASGQVGADAVYTREDIPLAQ